MAAYLNASLGKIHEYYRFVDFLFKWINGRLNGGLLWFILIYPIISLFLLGLGLVFRNKVESLRRLQRVSPLIYFSMVGNLFLSFFFCNSLCLSTTFHILDSFSTIKKRIKQNIFHSTSD